MEPLHTEQRHGLTIKIFQDENQDSPGDWGDRNLFLVGYHRDFWVEAPRIDTKRLDQNGKKVFRPLFSKDDLIRYCDPEKVCPKCESDDLYWDKDQDTFECGACGALRDDPKLIRPDVFKDYHLFPLEAYIHGGVRLYFRGGCVVDRAWDVSQVGAVLVSKQEWPDQDKAVNAAKGLIDTWNDYLSGNVYGFVITDSNGQDVESCWGFYGDYDKEGGALLEARAIIDHMTNNGTTEKNGQMLFEFLQN